MLVDIFTNIVRTRSNADAIGLRQYQACANTKDLIEGMSYKGYMAFVQIFRVCMALIVILFALNALTGQTFVLTGLLIAAALFISYRVFVAWSEACSLVSSSLYVQAYGYD